MLCMKIHSVLHFLLLFHFIFHCICIARNMSLAGNNYCHICWIYDTNEVSVSKCGYGQKWPWKLGDKKTFMSSYCQQHKNLSGYSLYLANTTLHLVSSFWYILFWGFRGKARQWVVSARRVGWWALNLTLLVML